MAVDNGVLKPSQERAYAEVIDLCRRAAPHLTRLRIQGVPLEQDEQRMEHLLKACEGVFHHNEMLKKAEAG